MLFVVGNGDLVCEWTSLCRHVIPQVSQYQLDLHIAEYGDFMVHNVFRKHSTVGEVRLNHSTVGFKELERVITNGGVY